MTGPTGVERLDSLPTGPLEAELTTVCASRTWASRMAARSPYGDLATLLAAAEEELAALSEDDVDEALAGHPRIGERTEGDSNREQAGVTESSRAALVRANADYEARFGHVYLVCASGRSGEELLALLRERLANDPVTERRVLRRELAKINAIRLRRLTGEEG